MMQSNNNQGDTMNNSPKDSIKISRFHLTEVYEGLAIADCTGAGGYQAELCQELARVHLNRNGGVISLDAEGFGDLAEWADCMADANRGHNNPGATSFDRLSSEAHLKGLALLAMCRLPSSMGATS